MSCGPAVPPPPVAGAAVGGLLAAGLAVADAGAVRVTAGVAADDAGGLALALAPAPAPAPALALALAVPLAVLAAGVGEVVPGENEDEGVPAEHAETAAEMRMVMVLQPATASLALSPARAMAARTFIKPPHAPAGCGPPGSTTAKRPSQAKTRPARAAPAKDGRPGTVAAAMAGPADGADAR